MKCTDKSMLNENIIKVDEKKVSEIIEKVCNLQNFKELDNKFKK
jgi:hypothetical protein